MSDEHVVVVKEGGCLKGCGIAALVIVGLLLAGGIYVYMNITGWVAGGVHTAMVQVINDSQLPQKDKDGLVKQLDRVLEAFNNGDLVAADLERIGVAMESSQIIPMAGIVFYESTYVDKSELPAEEKANAKLQAQRFARGVFQEKIPEAESQKVFDMLTEPDPTNPGETQLKGSLTVEELNEITGAMTKINDEAEISNEPYEIDLPGELKKIVDEILKKNDVPVEGN